MAISLDKKHGICKSCKADQNPKLCRMIGQNGGEHFTWVCSKCQQHGCFSNGQKGSPPFFIARESVLSVLSQQQIEALEVIMPDASYRCVKCGVRQAELHHWAPKEIFGAEEAEKWPKDYLCVKCHLLWHKTINEFKK